MSPLLAIPEIKAIARSETQLPDHWDPCARLRSPELRYCQTQCPREISVIDCTTKVPVSPHAELKGSLKNLPHGRKRIVPILMS
ncbi:hypothetical protein CEXT_741821 [Caerostris extrusa]|uniref:Uncharacterized protein n=1 Tax=Caerostris extrusa TaxID=172846 RepID=A0AAV4QLI3_CAEEX|nr:hypothetical protein CEXT_741821 [Caerostris extrusa]